MSLIDASVRRPALTILLFLLMVSLGLSAWQAIPRQEDPTFPIPIYTVVAALPGAAPVDMERLVIRPLEDRLGELEQVKELDARITGDVATLQLEFAVDIDVDQKYGEVQREVDAMRAELPAELALLEVRKTTAQNVGILQVALVSPTASDAVLDRLAETLEDRLETVPGIRRARRWATAERQVLVELDVGRLTQLGIGTGQVLGAVQGESADIPGGAVSTGDRRFTVRTSGSYTSPEAVGATVVAGRGDAVVRVRDVATVGWASADPEYVARFDGQRAVFVNAEQLAGWKIGDVRDGAWAVLDRFEAELPGDVTLARGFDQSVNVANRLSRLGTDFLIAIGLVLVTLLPLGLRASAVVMVAIPLSLALGLAALQWLGFSLNQLSIVGFVIALGLLVDDSIVVVENIARTLREGASRVEAAIAGTRQITKAVLGATAVLVFAFLPLMLLPGLSGRYIRSLPVAVVVTVLASMLVAFTVIPWLASVLLPREERHEGNRVLRAVLGVIDRTYAPLLARALARPRTTLALSAALVAGVLALVPVVGFSLFPKAETPQFRIDVRLPVGSSLAATDSAVRFTERAVGRRAGVRAVFSNIGHDNPQVYYNVVPAETDPTVGQLFVVLDAYDPHTTPLMLDTLRQELAQYPGARLEVKEFENGPPIDAPIALRIQGTDLDTLQRIAGEVEALVAATPGTRYVVNPVRRPRTDLHVAIDRGKAGLLGVATIDVDRAVRMGLAGLEAGEVREADGSARPILVRLPHDGLPEPSALERIWIPASSGGAVPLAQVATVDFSSSPAEIQRYQARRTVTVSSDVQTGENVGRVTDRVLAALGDVALPPGYDIVPAGELESRSESFGGLGGAIAVAVFGILGILVLEFGTFKSTLIVASVIPLGMIGGIGALFLTGNTLSFTATIGFVALIGIEIKTTILLVDFTNQLRRDGVPLREAVMQAGEVRFLPIVLTACTAIGGLLPVALQGTGLYAPLAWVIIGGLVSSTLLARLVTPVLYVMLEPEA
ncbi:MAG: efflux RND transporter permease subunit [Gemmatimonadetes bacterium]|nr:efflux RND transporter permease subunit [Gemmatimonadota bacterium]MCB9518064.1 efflux RND transporter permease subunit [Gemmatimonadales bacterium]